MDDFDIEMGDAVDVPMEEPEVAEILIGDDLQEDGEIEEALHESADADAQKVIPNKVHIRGLDLLDETQLKTYLSINIGGKGADRIEWVNDTSANLVFSSAAAAQEALVALCAVEIGDPTQLPASEVLPAKTFAEKPEVALQVRFAVESDRKERGAAQKSRFYLFHPDWDPETDEGRRKREGRDRRYRDRDERGGRRRNGRSRYEERYRDEEPDSFDVNLYDDDAGALSRRAATRSPRRGRDRRRDSRSPSDHSELLRGSNRDKELFPNSRKRDALRSERGAYQRDRSASPSRDHRDAIEDDLAKDKEAVRNNREKARSIKDQIYARNGDKGRNNTRELFPTGGKKELFPARATDGSGKAQMDHVLEGMACLSYDGAVDFYDGRPPSFSCSPTSTSPTSGSGATRMSVKGSRWVTVRLTNRVTDATTNRGTTSIRGLSRQNQGMMTIKGTAKSVKELFPNTFNDDSNITSGNAGKELFADRSEGRGRRRQRAEDLFH